MAASQYIGKSVYLYNLAQLQQLGARPDNSLYQTTNRAAWEMWLVIDTGDDRFALRSYHGAYLGSNSQGVVSMNSTLTDAEQWRIESSADSSLTILSAITGRALSIAANGTASTATSKGATERFRIEEHLLVEVNRMVGRRVHVVNASSLKQLSVNQSGVTSLSTNRLDWETFQLRSAGPDEYALISFHNTALSAQTDNKVTANGNNTTAERWRIVPGPDGGLHIVSGVQNKRLGATDTDIYIGNSGGLGEQWRIEDAARSTALPLPSDFTEFYNDHYYTHTTTVTHQGTVVAFAMDASRCLYYAVLKAGANTGVESWSATAQAIQFPTEMLDVGFAAAETVRLPGVKPDGTQVPAGSLPMEDLDAFRSTTARFTASTQFQVISEGPFLYVFRQAIESAHPSNVRLTDAAGQPLSGPAGEAITACDGALLVDRFLLVGDKLQPKLEVRYQRSRSKSLPQSNKDSLDAKDLDGTFFFEPTSQLRFVRDVRHGRFAVLLLPTQNNEIRRWQIFAHNARTGRVDSYNVERSREGMFNVRGTQFYTCSDHSEVFEAKSGTCTRPKETGSTLTCGKALVPQQAKSGAAEWALQFDGVDDHATVASVPAMQSATYTVEFFIKPETPGREWSALVYKTLRNFNILLHSSGYIQHRFVTTSGTNPVGAGSGADSIKWNEWNHVAVTNDGQKACIYINGMIKELFPSNGEAMVGDAAPLFIGRAIDGSTAGYYKGAMDELRLWNRARTSQEIAADMNRRLLGDEPGLTGYWRFDEGTSTRFANLTSLPLQGTTLGNMSMVRSTAPLGELPGISRTSLEITGRTLESGIAARLYYQQENVPAGYAAQAKPLKQSARVMLATATRGISALEQGESAPGEQDGWSWCNKCMALHYTDVSTPTVCQAGGEHNWDGSANYIVPLRMGPEGSVSVPAKSGVYDWSTSWSLPDTGSGYISFVARGNSDVLVAISPLNSTVDPMYEICIGGNNNTQTHIRRKSQGTPIINVNAGLVSQTGDNPLWISLNRTTGQVQVGRGKPGENVIATLTDAAFLTAARFIAFSSYNNPIQYSKISTQPLGLQTGWAWCKKCGVLHYTPAAGKCAVDGQNHDASASGNYGMWPDGSAALGITQVGWQWCKKCSCLWYSYTGQPGKCPADNGAHDATGSGNYLLRVSKRELTDARRNRIAVLDFGLGRDGKLADPPDALALSTLNSPGAAEYATLLDNVTRLESDVNRLTDELRVATATVARIEGELAQNFQPGWERCNKCLSLYYPGSNTATPCPNGGVHVRSAGSPFFLFSNCNPVGSQAEWRFCNKCSCLFHAAAGNNACPAGGKHVDPGWSGNYAMLVATLTTTSLDTEPRYKWCKHCGTMFFNIFGNPPPKCAGNPGGTHDGSSSAFYAIPYGSSALVIAQQNRNTVATQLASQQAALSQARAALQGELQVPMKLAAIDARGLTLSGGVLGFAWARGTPTLFDSATGQLTLYFRGLRDQLFVAYFDAMTARARFAIKSGTANRVLLIARAADAEMDNLLAQVAAGSAPELCKLTISGGNITEMWNDVPRAPSDFVLTLIGRSTSYDYALKAQCSSGASLARGSLLVTASDEDSTVPIVDGAATSLGRTPSCQWVANAAGRSLTLDGTNDYASQLDDIQAGRELPLGDLTMEAWAKPELVTDISRVITHRNSSAGYTLGVQRADLMSAMKLNGTQAFQIGTARELNLTSNDFTVEMWIYRESMDDRTLFGTDPWPDATVANRVNRQLYMMIMANGLPLFTFWGNDTFGKTVISPNTWHHLAFRYNKANGEQAIFVNGKLDVARTGCAPFTGDQAVTVGGAMNASYFVGRMDDVRVWDRTRSEEEIRTDMQRRLTGAEENLRANWYYQPDGVMRDTAAGYRVPSWRGAAAPTIGSPLPAYNFFAAVDSMIRRSKAPVLCGEWHHLAAAFTRSYAAKLPGATSYLECPDSRTLDITDDLTLEVNFQFSGGTRSLIEKGGLSGSLPYGLYFSAPNLLIFAFRDTNGNLKQLIADIGVQTAGTFLKVALTRESHADTDNAGQTTRWTDITLYLNGQKKTALRWEGAPAASGDQPLRFGYQPNLPGVVDVPTVISEVRVWNTARTASAVSGPISGNEEGLVSWWRFRENSGRVAADSKSNNHATFRGNTSWVNTPDPQGCILKLYRDGVEIAPEQVDTPTLPTTGVRQLTVGAVRDTSIVKDRFQGALDEIRVWRAVRTPVELRDNLYGRAMGEREELLAYYTFDEDRGAQIRDQSVRGNHLTWRNDTNADSASAHALSTAPIASDSPIVRSALAGVKTAYHDLTHGAPSVVEYGQMQQTSEGDMGGALKRCYSFVKDGRWRLLTGFKVGDLTAEWMSQVQYAPQLMGYIEGAPPVPSENLTISGTKYQTTVDITEAEKATYSYSTNTDRGADATLEGGVGFNMDVGVSAGIAVIKKIVTSKAKVAAKFKFEFGSSWIDDNAKSTARSVNKLSRMIMQGSWINGKFEPRNEGYALVKSKTADLFALRMRHNRALVAFQLRENPDIPEDWNIIHFPINPRYTKLGTLDGKVGAGVDSNYPNAAAYSPDRSYFKPIEAYSMKNAIKQQEEELRTVYDQQSTDPFRPSGLPDLSKRNLVNTYVWTADGGLYAESQQVLDVQKEMHSGVFNTKAMAGISASKELAFSGIGVVFELTAMAGGHFKRTAVKSMESQTSFGLNVDLGNVERDILLRDSAGAIVVDTTTDPMNPRPKKQPWKVDAYRFMTFYLEPESRNFDEFFNKVVDPIWYRESNEPYAVALREAYTNHSQSRSPCWRVMHRVTYVSRVLPEITNPAAAPFEKALLTLDIDSSYELIKRLEPFVGHLTQKASDFDDAARQAIARYMPTLVPHTDEILRYLRLYYGLSS